MHVLLDDDLGRLTVRRVSPWHRLLARVRGASLDRQLAGGARPEANPLLAARSMVLTSAGYRRALATSLRRILAGAAEELAGLAECLTARRPVPARGVALVSQLLTDGGGPLYRAGGREDLGARLERAAQALSE